MSFYDDDDQDVDYNCEAVEDTDDVESRFGSEAAFRSQENIHSVTMKTLRGGKQQRQGCRAAAPRKVLIFFVEILIFS